MNSLDINLPETIIIDVPEGASSRKRNFDQALQDSPEIKKSNSDPDQSIAPNDSKLGRFQKEPLEDDVNYSALKSAMDLLESRVDTIKRDIKELNNFKKNIRYAKDIKEMQSTIHSNSDYLREICYKGITVKCPVINWKNSYGVDINGLKNQDKLQDYERVNESYEILRKDKIFN